MPIMALMIKRYGDRLHDYFKLAQAAFSSLNDRTQESLTSIRMIKAFGLVGPPVFAVCGGCRRYRQEKYARGAY